MFLYVATEMDTFLRNKKPRPEAFFITCEFLLSDAPLGLRKLTNANANAPPDFVD